ncbi:hypothetical protein PVAND_003496 [Polypedilum vanderplanki]|uniref:Uncharacterized protein n=1 Tax=Polypedilum vanderplanki TaxID=319348 RepID=A0A9J6BUQ0_POLVA|nr:hypothetical protein PVAND_003496 [Polypedilum vanderplanki]
MKIKIELMMLAYMIKKQKVNQFKVQYAKVTPEINEIRCESLEENDIETTSKFSRSMDSLSVIDEGKLVPRSPEVFRRKSLVAEIFFGEKVKPESGK